MKFRVREGKSWRGARSHEVVDVEPHKAQLVPWCLEPVDEAAPVETKPKSKKK